MLGGMWRLLLVLLLSGCATTVSDLERVNEQAKLAPGNCQDHVREVARLLHGRYEVEGLYTWGPWLQTRHVSALVHTEEGMYILDNGSLRFINDVIPVEDFVSYSREFWVGDLPKAE